MRRFAAGLLPVCAAYLAVYTAISGPGPLAAVAAAYTLIYGVVWVLRPEVSDGRPCEADTFIAALSESGLDGPDAAAALTAWAHGEWAQALNYLPRRLRARIERHD